MKEKELTRRAQKRFQYDLVLFSFIALLFSIAARPAFGQPAFPVIPDIMGYWTFDETNWPSDWSGLPPMSFTNINSVPSWSGNALQVDSTNAAWLQYHVVETNGITNLICPNGAVELWFNPDWAGTNLGGTGPRNWGMLIDAGAWTSNSSYGWWSLYVNPAGTGIYFSGQTNTGLGADYLSAPISWDSNEWHHILLNYSPTNSQLYLDGQLATNGTGVAYYPGPTALSNGFFVGSDCIGQSQCRGQIEDLFTYDGQFDSNGVAGEYAGYIWGGFVYPLPDSGGGADVPIGGGLGMAFSMSGSQSPNSPQSYGTSAFWLEVLKLGTNIYNSDTNSVTLLLHGTIPDIVYQLQSTTNLNRTNTVWTVEQTLIGAVDTNFTPTTVSMTGRKTVFFRALAYTLDSNGSGLPDWWQLLYFGHLGVDPYANPAGDGWSNLQKFNNGWNPSQFYTPPPPQNVTARLDATGTNVVLNWTSGGGPVDHYGIEDQVDGEIGTVTAATFTFTTGPDFPGFSNPFTEAPSPQAGNFIRAYFTNGSHADSQMASIYKPVLQSDVTLVPGPLGQAYLTVASPPPGLSQILLYWVDISHTAHTLATINATNLVNGIVGVPTNQLNGYPLENGFMCTLLGTNGTFGGPVQVYPAIPEEEFGHYLAPFRFNFMDTRAHLKENLKFLLRAATITKPFSFITGLSTDGNIDNSPDPSYIQNPELWFARPPSPTNYEYYGSRTFIPAYNYSELMPLRAIQDNYFWRNYAFLGTFSIGQSTGVYFDFGNDVRVLDTPAYRYSGTGMESPLPMPLSSSDDTWLFWAPLSSDSLADFDYADAAEVGVFLTGNNLVVGSGVVNCYQLPLNSIAIETTTTQVAVPGSTVSFSGYLYFPNFATPAWSIADYYFASQTRYLSHESFWFNRQRVCTGSSQPYFI